MFIGFADLSLWAYLVFPVLGLAKKPSPTERKLSEIPTGESVQGLGFKGFQGSGFRVQGVLGFRV